MAKLFRFLRTNISARTASAIVVGVALLGILIATVTLRTHNQAKLERKQKLIYEAWKARCQTSGVFIHKTVPDVEAIFLMPIRTEEYDGDGRSARDQFRLSDPYGNDVAGEGYIKKFLRKPGVVNSDVDVGAFSYVEGVDPKNGNLYRYELLGEGLKATLQRTLIASRSARYAVTFKDISTREDRNYWIAGSSLRVVDLETNELLGERIGYMVDSGMGRQDGGRAVWSYAAEHACPSFFSPNAKIKVPGSIAQLGQTVRFVRQVLVTQSTKSSAGSSTTPTTASGKGH